MDTASVDGCMTSTSVPNAHRLYSFKWLMRRLGQMSRKGLAAQMWRPKANPRNSDGKEIETRHGSIYLLSQAWNGGDRRTSDSLTSQSELFGKAQVHEQEGRGDPTSVNKWENVWGITPKVAHRSPHGNAHKFTHTCMYAHADIEKEREMKGAGAAKVPVTKSPGWLTKPSTSPTLPHSHTRCSYKVFSFI